MNASLTTIISFLTGALGGLIGAYFQARFQRRTQVSQHQHELKQKRYLSILILMLTKLIPNAQMSKTQALRPDLKGVEDIDRELETEVLNGFIFASDSVLKALLEFIGEPDYQSFLKATNAMRDDLWGGKSKFGNEMLNVIKSVDR
jgi:hypothetical protein